MKRSFTFLMAAFALVVSMTMPLGMKGQTTSTLTLSSSKKFGTSDGSTLTTETQPSITWTVNKTSGSGTIQNSYQTSYHGQQFGTSSAPWGGTFSATYANTVTSVKVDANTGGAATLSVTVGGASFSCGNQTSVAVTKNANSQANYYEFTGSGNGAVVITLIGTSKACYFGGVIVTYTSGSTPGLSVSPSSIDFGSVAINPLSAYEETFEVAFANLTDNLSVSVGSGLTGVSVNPTTISKTASSPATVTVSYNPTAAGNLSGNITVGNTADNVSKPVAVTGSAYDQATAPKYVLYTGTITEGDYVIYYDGKAMKNTVSSQNRLDYSIVAPSGDNIYNPDASIVWHIAPNGNYWTIYNTSVSKYAAGNGTANKAILVGEIDQDGDALWSFDADRDFVNKKNATASVNAILRNNSTYGFACYGSGTGGTLSLYKLASANQVAAPTFSPDGGSYTSAQSVTISCATSGATIYYTTDGSTPTSSSATYSSAIAVSTTTTIKAIAVKDGVSSAVSSATYTITTPCTITLNAGNGSCSTPSMTGASGSSISLPTATPSTTCAEMGWSFAGWAASSVDFTTTAPTLYTGSYTITNSTTLYAVYSTGAAFNNTAGGNFIIYAVDGSTNYYANGTISSSKIGSTDQANEAAIYIFEKPSDYGDGEYAIKSGSSYITYTSSTNVSTSDQPYKWTISAAGTYGTWRVTASTDTSRALIFRTSDSNNEYYKFGCYKTSNVNGSEYFDLEIGGDGEATYATSPDCTDLTVSESSLTFLFDGGSGSFDFTVSNPVSGATATATTSESWITNFAVSGNTVSFQVAANNGGSRSGEIMLTYAKNGTTLASATVAVNQDSNPILPGGADNPYTVAEALAVIEDYNDNQTSAGEVYVTGIVSKIDEIEVVQYHNAKYYISDDGTTNDQLMSYYGRYINNTDFMSEDELMMGDSVVIKGRLKKYVKNNSNNTTTTTPELDRGNYIVSLYRAVQPVTFNPGSCVTPESIWVNLFTESLFDWEAQIYYTTNGADPITSGTAFEDAMAADLELTQTTTLKAAAYVPELNKWSAVTEATYTIVPAGSGGWQGQPYTVSEALAALDQNSDIKGAYVHGIVSRIIQIDTTRYYNATYYISDDGEENNELYVFRGKYISRSDFTSTDQLKPGDEVTVYGDLSIYHETTKEFKAKNYIEDWYRPASIIITPDHFDFSSNATSGLIHVTYSNDIQVITHNPEVQFCDATGAAATYDWLTVTPSEANDWDLEYIIEANEGSAPRTAYLKVSGQDSQSNVIVSNIISITQSEYKVDFAELPFSFSGGHGDIDDTPGLTGEHLGTYAAENTRLKFANPSNQMSTLVLKINETPGKLTYRIKGNGMQGGTFKVQQSSNGITYTDLASYTDLANDTLWVSIDTLRPSTRYIRWIFVTRNKGNVGVGSIHLYKPANSPCTYAFSVNGAVGEQQSSTVGEVVTMPVGSNITFNGQVFAFRGWTTNPNNVSNLLTNGASHTLSRDVTFYAVYNQQAAGDEADKHYAKVTREPVDWSGDYLIVYEEEGLAFNGGLDPLDVTGNVIQVMISDGVITATQALAAAKFTIAPFEDGYSIKSASGYYIGKNADSNGMDANASTEYKNIISYNEDEGEIDIIGLDGARLRYNPTSNQNRFRYYKASTYTGQEGIQLYRYVGGVDNLFTRIFINVTADNITIEGPSIIPNGSVLNAATITNNLGADRLVIDEGGQLVTSSNVNATMEKSITPYQDVYDNYYLVASPVNNLDPTTAGMTGTNFDLYSFDQSAQGAEWRNYEAGSFATLETGKGYLYANDYGGDINMGGTMTATANAVTIANVSGKPFAGWNLIGNPYPCNVTIGRPFYRLASGGAALATEATDRSVAIAPMEGVFVCADGTETVSFTKAPTTSTTSGRNLLSMRVSRSRGSKDERIDADNAIVRFGEGDQLRKLVLNPDLTQLYVAQDGRDYAIVNAEAEGEMPVSFRPAENGSYIFSVAAEGVTMRYLHLIDHKTGADVDLLKTPSYTFEANTGDYEGRFKLVFACGDTNDGNETFAYYNGSQWVVSNEGEATLQVVDMMGRVLSSQSIKGNAEVNVDRAAGVYLLRLMSGDDVKVQKIVIQ